MTAPATFTNAKPSEADSLILRATHLIDRLRGHAERNRFDAPRALKIARTIEANMEISAPTLQNLSQPAESAPPGYDAVRPHLRATLRMTLHKKATENFRRHRAHYRVTGRAKGTSQ